MAQTHIKRRKYFPLAVMAAGLSAAIIPFCSLIEYEGKAIDTEAQIQPAASSALISYMPASADSSSFFGTCVDPPHLPAAADTALLQKYLPYFLENRDICGWVSVDGTKLSYPVMRRQGSPFFYLDHSFNTGYAYRGLPFLDPRSLQDSSASVDLIYSHNMRDGSMFGTLTSYRKASYYSAHSSITYDTLYEQRTFQVFCVLECDDKKGYPYKDNIDLASREEYNEFVDAIVAESLYDTGSRPQYGDKLVFFVTCSYHSAHGRLAVGAYLRTAS